MDNIILIEDLLKVSQLRFERMENEDWMDGERYDSEEEYWRDWEHTNGKIDAYQNVLKILKDKIN